MQRLQEISTTATIKLKDGSLDDAGIVLFWKMMIIVMMFHCYKIPIWLAQGRKDLSDDRVIWDWLKYNIRAHAKQHSKRRAKERNEKVNRLTKNTLKQGRILRQILIILIQIS